LKIAILGSGNVGTALGTHWANAGHQVVFGSRDPGSAKVQEAICRVNPTACAELHHISIQDADVIVLAVPWQQAEAVLGGLGDLTGRVIIDCSNPLKPDLSGLETAGGPSAAERIAGWAPGAHVVKAFNTVSTKVMKDPKFDAHQATMFYCGDNAQAKAVVHELCQIIGFEPVDAGPLSSAGYLESLAMLYIHLAFKQGWGSNCAFKILKR
jgi:NADPH-dependent F420 reductase